MADVYGIEFPDLEQGLVAISAVVLLTTFCDDGEMYFVEMKSPKLSAWEALGMGVSFTDSQRRKLQTYAPPDDVEPDADDEELDD